jgi:hypothetical protein
MLGEIENVGDGLTVAVLDSVFVERAVRVELTVPYCEAEGVSVDVSVKDR